MQREIIRFNGRPVQVRLDQAPDKAILKEGLKGVQYQIVCNDDASIMWLPPEAHAALMQCGARAGDGVSIQKLPRGWNVYRLGDAAEPPAPNGNGNGHSYPPPPLPDKLYTQPTTAQMQPAALAFAGCLKSAMDACIEAQQYARAKGSSLQFQPEHIQAIACTLYIQQSKAARS